MRIILIRMVIWEIEDGTDVKITAVNASCVTMKKKSIALLILNEATKPPPLQSRMTLNLPKEGPMPVEVAFQLQLQEEELNEINNCDVNTYFILIIISSFYIHAFSELLCTLRWYITHLVLLASF